MNLKQIDLAPEFDSWPMNDLQLMDSIGVRMQFDSLMTAVSKATPAHNQRYLSIVKTKLEEACFFAIKGIAKPQEENK